MKLGVAIPCYKYHIPVLKRCLDSLENQIIKPDIVVVSCSSCVREDIPIYSYSFALEILCTEEKKNAAENRNIAGKVLLDKGCDILSFFDCDDEMHPQRIDFIRKSFMYTKDCSIVLHNYFENDENMKEFILYPFVSLEKNIMSRAPSGCAYIVDQHFKKIHHSQVSVNRDVFNRIKFREQKECERKEDALFCGDILAGKNINIYIDNKLSKYYPEGQTYTV